MEEYQEVEYTIYALTRTNYLDENGELFGFVEIYVPEYYTSSKEKALKKFEEIPFKCRPFIDDFLYYDDEVEEEEKRIGYICVEYDLVESIGKERKTIKEKKISDFDEELNDDFFRELLKKVKKENIVFHNWIENPTTEQILELQNLD